MDDYYSYKPLYVLDRPLVLTGFIGARVDEVARLLARLTGIKMVDLGRSIEHEAGMSIAQLVLQQGTDALRAHEAAVLGRTSLEGCSLILPLLDDTLTVRAHRDRLRSETRVVYLRQSLQEMKHRIAALLEQRKTRHYALLFGAVPEDAQLRDLFETRRAGYESAHETIDIGLRSPIRTADIFIDQMKKSA